MITHKRIFRATSGNVIGVVDCPRWFKRLVGGQPMVRIGFIGPRSEIPEQPPRGDFRVIITRLLEFLETRPDLATKKQSIEKLTSARKNVHLWAKARSL